MKKIGFIILTVFMCITTIGCEEHLEPVDLSLKIGNIYRTDGTIVPIDYHLAQGKDSPEAVGVVCAVGEKKDNYNALVVALNDLGNEYYFANDTVATKASSDLELFNGKENTAALLAEYGENENLSPMGAVMATAYTAGNIAGWHLPSVAELYSIVKNKGIIISSIKQVGGEDFEDEWYLTSTVDGTSDNTSLFYNYCIIMPEGRRVSDFRTSSHKVRPFLIIR